MIKSLLVISAGASIGAIARWLLGTRLNAIFPAIPLGTLAANLIGGYLIGFFIAFFAQNASISPEWRLFIITGFLGGLTTFSTFSAEIVSLLQQANYQAMAIGLFAHVGGSLLMTTFGIFSFRLLSPLIN